MQTKTLKERSVKKYKEYKKVRNAEGTFIVDPETNLEKPFLIRIYRRKPLVMDFELTNSNKEQRDIYDPLKLWLISTGKNWIELKEIDAFELVGATEKDWEDLKGFYKRSEERNARGKDHPFYCELPDVRGKCSLWDYVDYEKRNNVKLDTFVYYDPEDFVFYAYPAKYTPGMEAETPVDPKDVKREEKYNNVFRGEPQKPRKRTVFDDIVDAIDRALARSEVMWTFMMIIEFVLIHIYMIIRHPIYYNIEFHDTCSGLHRLGFKSTNTIYDPDRLLINPKLRKEAAKVGIYDVNNPKCRMRNHAVTCYPHFDNFFNRMRKRYLKYVPSILRILVKFYIIAWIAAQIYAKRHGLL